MRHRFTSLALFVMVLMMTGLSYVDAQVTFTVGTGTSSTSYPVNMVWMHSRSEAVYTSAEMTSGGWTGGPGTISNVRWNIATGASYTPQTGSTLKIYLENTTQTTMSSGTPSTSGTLVWSGAHPLFNVTGWWNFTLSTPFVYTGGNLIVRVERDDTNWGSGAYFYYTTTTTTMHRGAYQDYTPPTSLTADYNRPNIQFVATQGGDPPPFIVINTVPGCVASTSPGTTITTTITDNNSVAQAAIWFRKNTGSWYNAAPTSVVGSAYTFAINHSTLGGLVNNDVVSWYIGARDNANNVATSPYGGSGTTPPGSTPPTTFNSYTAETILPLPYTQGFDTPGHGWTLGGTSSTWRIGAPAGSIGTTAASTPNALCMQSTGGVYNASENSWAMSPSLDFSSLTTDPVIAFSHKYDFENGYDGGQVDYSTDGGATWVQLGTYPPITSSLNWYNSSGVYGNSYVPCWVGTATSAWVRSVHPLTGLAGQACVKIRFHGQSDGSVQYAGWAIDDVAIGNFPEKDIEVMAVNVGYAPNRWSQNISQPHVVSTVIRTNGWETPPTSVTLVYKEGSAPTSAVDGVAQSFTPTWTSGMYTATFTTPYVPPTTGPRTIYVRAFYTGDAATANDSKSYAIDVQTDKVYGFENFEGLTPAGLPTNFRTGWNVVNNGGPATWGVYTANFGGLSTAGAYITDGNSNDYLVSPAALLAAGSSYNVKFKYATIGTATLQLLYGKTADPTTMNVVRTWNLGDTPTWTDAEGTIPGSPPYFNTDPAAPGNYYIAFKVQSTSYAVVVDNIILEDNPSPPPKIGYGLPGAPVASYNSDPTVPIQVTANYKSPGLINKTYAVTTTTDIFGKNGDFLWDVTSSTPWIKITKSVPDPTLQGYNFTPPRPRQFQTFTMTIDPSGMPIGLQVGEITFYGMLFNDTFTPPNNGLKATNEPLKIKVELRIMGSGSSAGPSSMVRTMGPLTAGNTYPFTDPGSGTPIATVQVTGGQIDMMTITVFPNQLPQNIARMLYVKRYWQIQHTGTGWTANITFPYADLEASMVLDRMQLRGVRQAVPLGPWEDPIIGTTSTSDPMNTQVKVFNFNPGNIGGNIALAQPYPMYGKDNAGAIPAQFGLEQNYPNPFNPSTTISFNVAEERFVRLTVFNSLGAEVAELVNQVMPAGHYTVSFDASGLTSGTYIYRMTAGDFVQTQRMTLSK